MKVLRLFLSSACRVYCEAKMELCWAEAGDSGTAASLAIGTGGAAFHNSETVRCYIFRGPKPSHKCAPFSL